MEIESLDDVITVDELIRIYFTKVFYLCNHNKSEVARRLNLSIRTVRTYCIKFGLNTPLVEERRVEIQSPKSKYGYKGVTSSQRDEWYNKDSF